MRGAVMINNQVNLIEMGKLQARTEAFRSRLETTEEVIRYTLQWHQDAYVSSSFGKDSVVLLHLLIQLRPNIPVMFINSNYCFPDTYQVRDEFVRRYKINLHEIKQPYDYMELIYEYGLPHERTRQQQKQVVELLKKDLGNQWAKDNQKSCCFWGLRKEESRGRAALLNSKGRTFYNETKGLFFSAPLADWKWEDIWAYIAEFNVPFSEIYTKQMFCDPRQIRNTSWITTDGLHKSGRLQWLRYYYPEYFNRLADAFPRITSYV